MMKRTNWLIVVGVALVLLVQAGTANAAPATARLFFVSSFLRFRAPADRPVDLTVFLNDEGVVTLRDDFGRITPGPGCVAVSPREVECDHPAAGEVDFVGSFAFENLVRLQFAPPRGFSGLGGASDDQFFGQSSNDRFQGNAGDDELHGRGGQDDLSAWDGADRLFGGSGNDRLELDSLESPDEPDEVSGGPGVDQVRYGSTDETLRVSLNDIADDGVAGEHDNVLSDVEDVLGSTGDDVLEGDGDDNQLGGQNGDDVLIGGGGNDALGGRRGDDRLVGDQGNDRLFGWEDQDDLFGSRGDDMLRGGEDHDDLFGHRGDDTLDGEEGNDSLTGGDGHDDLFGRGGSDHLDTVDDVADRADCGAGIDVATVDALDQVSASCETVNVIA
jgi:Ca2+-binding RTX toxin-like protein